MVRCLAFRNGQGMSSPGNDINNMSRSCPDYFYQQSAVVPCRLKEGRVEVLLITTVNKGKWSIPKGVVELHLSPWESAAQEAFEEAGIRGEVVPRSVGSYSYQKWNDMCVVSVFPMLVTEVLEDWPESGIRRRKWVSGDEASSVVAKKALRPLVTTAVADADRILKAGSV